MTKDEVINELIASLGWSNESLQVWKNAEYRCEYCKADLLADIDVYLYGSHIDHIVPGAGNNLDNLALACKTCNYIKCDKNFSESEHVLTRKVLIEKVWKYISEIRKQKIVKLARVKLLLGFLSESNL